MVISKSWQFYFPDIITNNYLITGVPLHNLSLLYVIDEPSARLFAAPGRRHAQMYSLGRFYFVYMLTSRFVLTCRRF